MKKFAIGFLCGLAVVCSLASYIPASNIRQQLFEVGSNRGDADVTLTVGTDKSVQIFSSVLTGNRTVTLSTTGAVNGDRFIIKRTGLGLFTLNINSLYTVASATAANVEVVYDGSAWILLRWSLL